VLAARVLTALVTGAFCGLAVLAAASGACWGAVEVQGNRASVRPNAFDFPNGCG
jgi:hypothetical protein